MNIVIPSNQLTKTTRVGGEAAADIPSKAPRRPEPHPKSGLATTNETVLARLAEHRVPHMM